MTLCVSQRFGGCYVSEEEDKRDYPAHAALDDWGLVFIPQKVQGASMELGY